MFLAAAVILLASLLLMVFVYLQRLAADEHSNIRQWFKSWAAKGLGVPILFWIVWNLGILPGLPPLVLQMVQAGGGTQAQAFVKVLASGLMVIGFYWATISLAWFLIVLCGRKDIQTDLLGSAFLWSVLMLPLAALIIYLGGWLWAGVAGVAWLLPIAHSALPLAAVKQIGPAYSRAIANMKMGKYEDAEWEILHQLEKCEDDFDGWMMLAELYANHFQDLAGAQRTIFEICSQPDATPSQISVALQRLADWHLKIAEDPAAARLDLEEICHRLPGTHLATMARYRINQLPADREALREQRHGRTIHLPALKGDLDETPPVPPSETSREQAAVEANRWVETLKANPDDTRAREELARVFAERLGKAELAIEQLSLLLEMPDQPAAKAAEWLSLVAAWQLKYRQDRSATRTVLELLVREHPNSVQAFAAQRHLKLMEVEEKLRKLRAGRITTP